MRESAVDEIPGWKRSLLLFWCYLRIASVVLGGGYAIIAAAREEFVRRRGWLSDADIVDMMTVIQTVPGLLAVNSAIYIGWRINRWSGAVSALLGALLPPITVVVLIAAGISRMRGVLESAPMQGAFRGVVACIVGMVLMTAFRMRKTIRTGFDLVLALICLTGLAIFKLSPVWLILFAIAAGVLRTAASRTEAKK